MSDQPHVVILGAGFGGIGALKNLSDANLKITIIDQHDYHTFQPLLYQVATDELAKDFKVANPVPKQLDRDESVLRVTRLGMDIRAACKATPRRQSLIHGRGRPHRGASATAQRKAVWPELSRRVCYPEPESRPQQTDQSAMAKPYLDDKRCPGAKHRLDNGECNPVLPEPKSANQSEYIVLSRQRGQLAERVPWKGGPVEVRRQ